MESERYKVLCLYADAEELGKKLGRTEVLMQDLKPDTTDLQEVWWDNHHKREIKTKGKAV